MRTRKIAMMTLVFLLALGLSVSFADGGGKGCGKGKKCLESKVMCKAKTILKNRDELELSDEQYEQIKKLKYDTKKELIKDQAEVDLIVVDIKSKLWEDKIDTVSIDDLIDKKYEIKKQKAKMLVGAYATIKSTLTKDQMDKLKDIYKKYKRR